jgi:hypothetical protein
MSNSKIYWFKRVSYLFKSYDAQVKEQNKDYASYADCNKKFFYDDYMDRLESDKKLIKIGKAVGVVSLLSLGSLGIYKIWSNNKTKKKKKKEYL